MASNYTKLDLKTFKTRLADGHYANATGARRGVGKSELTDDEKKKAYKAIDEHFGTSSEPAPKAAGTKRTAKAAPKAPAKAVAKTPVKARGAGRGKRAAKAGSTRGSKTVAEAAPAASQELADLHTGAQATRESLAGLASASELDSELDVKLAAQRGAKILQHSIDRIGELLGIAPEGVEQGTTTLSNTTSEDDAAADDAAQEDE